MLVLMEHSPNFGYFLEPEKSIHICDWSEEIEEAKACFQAAGISLQYIDGHCYMGGFIGGEEERKRWLQLKVEEWAEGVKTLSKVAA
eukprot:8855636-Ditylum_brightwellii.AAC.1